MNHALAAATVQPDGSRYGTVHEDTTFGRVEGRGYLPMVAALKAAGFAPAGRGWSKVSADGCRQAFVTLHDPKPGRPSRGWLCSVEIAPPGRSFAEVA